MWNFSGCRSYLHRLQCFAYRSSCLCSASSPPAVIATSSRNSNAATCATSPSHFICTPSVLLRPVSKASCRSVGIGCGRSGAWLMRGLMKILYRIGAMMHPCRNPLLKSTLADVTVCHLPCVLYPSCHATTIRRRGPRTPYACNRKYRPSRHTVS